MKEPKTFNIENVPYDLSESDDVFNFLLSDSATYYQSKSHLKENAIEYIRDGIPKMAIDAVLQKTSISRAQLSNILHISTRQLNRYEKDELLSSEQSNFLYEFTRIYTRSVDILGDAETANTWIARPNIALGDVSPIALLDTGEGARMVNDLLSQIEYGFVS